MFQLHTTNRLNQKVQNLIRYNVVFKMFKMIAMLITERGFHKGRNIDFTHYHHRDKIPLHRIHVSLSLIATRQGRNRKIKN